MHSAINQLQSHQLQSDTTSQLNQYPLIDALLNRRSRRFGKGMSLNGGPLAYTSQETAVPLSLSEEAVLAFAACGITGPALGELPYDAGQEHEAGSGNIMVNFIGRTIASGDAIHAVTLFVLNDDGAWMVKRPQDFPRSDHAMLVEAARDQRFVELYQSSRVRIADQRLDVPRELPYNMAFNQWSINTPGSTYFLPVNEFTALYINVLLTAFNEEFGYFVVDERNNFRPAGIAQFAKSKGDYLNDDLAGGRAATISFLESWLYEFAAIEQGAMLQNLGLMSQALGLGGFPHFAAHPYIWMQTLGFRMDEPRFSQVAGLGSLMKGALRLMGKDIPVPTAVGLEDEHEPLIKPFCPPYYRNMEEAVLAFVDYKFGLGTGTMRDGGSSTAWRDGSRVQQGIPKCSDKAIEATIAYCDYVYKRFGRFPANSGPFRTILAYQAHRLDQEFYAEYYKPEVLNTLNGR